MTAPKLSPAAAAEAQRILDRAAARLLAERLASTDGKKTTGAARP